VKGYAGAAERNQKPLLDVLRRVLTGAQRVLEIGSGTGQHAVYFASGMPELEWQPTDVDASSLASIEARRAEAALANLMTPRQVDAAETDWCEDVDAVVCINVIHISPWSVTVGLFEEAARGLRPGGRLVLYGPYRFSGTFLAESNDAFDTWLRSRDESWGVRDVDDLDRLAGSVGLVRDETVAMPANNHVLVFRGA